jgi:hypothetical protein
MMLSAGSQISQYDNSAINQRHTATPNAVNHHAVGLIALLLAVRDAGTRSASASLDAVDGSKAEPGGDEIDGLIHKLIGIFSGKDKVWRSDEGEQLIMAIGKEKPNNCWRLFLVISANRTYK